MAKRPRRASGGLEEDVNSLEGKRSPQKKPKPLPESKFGGMTEEEVCKLLLPDHMKPGLDIIFIGINPGLYSAYLGHHYCNANNHFWPCLFESGLIPKKLTYREDAELLNYGIGITNIVPRTTRAANELSRKEMREWSQVMIERMKELKPLVACFNGKGIYEIFSGGKCEVGVQAQPLPGTDTLVYVMPSTSGRAATYPKRADKLKFFYELKDLRDKLKAQRHANPTPPVVQPLDQAHIPQQPEPPEQTEAPRQVETLKSAEVSQQQAVTTEKIGTLTRQVVETLKQAEALTATSEDPVTPRQVPTHAEGSDLVGTPRHSEPDKPEPLCSPSADQAWREE